MNYIEARPGINIFKAHIVAVEEIDMMTCKITTIAGSYNSIYPSWRILMQAGQVDIKENPVNPETPVDKVNLWGRQYFAG